MTKAEMDAAIQAALEKAGWSGHSISGAQIGFLAGMRAAADGIADGALPYSIFGEAARKIRAAADELENAK